MAASGACRRVAPRPRRGDGGGDAVDEDDVAATIVQRVARPSRRHELDPRVVLGGGLGHPPVVEVAAGELLGRSERHEGHDEHADPPCRTDTLRRRRAVRRRRTLSPRAGPGHRPDTRRRLRARHVRPPAAQPIAKQTACVIRVLRDAVAPSRPSRPSDRTATGDVARRRRRHPRSPPAQRAEPRRRGGRPHPAPHDRGDRSRPRWRRLVRAAAAPVRPPPGRLPLLGIAARLPGGEDEGRSTAAPIRDCSLPFRRTPRRRARRRAADAAQGVRSADRRRFPVVRA